MIESGPPQPPDARRSPSYPQRVHIRERAQWQAVLAGAEEKLRAAQQKFAVLGPGADREKYSLLLAQLAGARDQIADAVRRLPMEVGGLYDEDKHRVEEAEKAVERILARWG